MIKGLAVIAFITFIFSMFMFYMHSIVFYLRRKKRMGKRCSGKKIDGYEYKYHNVVGFDDEI